MVNEAKSYRALCPTVAGRLTTLDLSPHLRAIPDASQLLTLFQVTLLLFQSEQLVLATPDGS